MKIINLILTILILVNLISIKHNIQDIHEQNLQLNYHLDNIERAIQNFPKADTSIKGNASYYSYQIGDYDSAEHSVCAVRDYPRGSWVLVSYNGKTTKCKVTDYGPDKSLFPERVIDLSPKVFQELAPISSGVIHNITISKEN